MPIDPTELAKLIPKETVNEIYKDAISGPAKEVGKLSTDVVKTARFVLFPFQIAAAFQDRLEPMLRRIGARVPEDQRIKAAPQVVGPCLEQMRFHAEQSDLWRMYEEVIVRSIDRETAPQVHPSFVHIISQLSRDEAWILYRLRDSEFTVVDTLDLNRDTNRFENRKVEVSELPLSELYLPDQIDLLYSHLESLQLVSWPVLKQDPIRSGDQQTGIRRTSKMLLTDFGKLFVKTCIPPRGFEPK